MVSARIIASVASTAAATDLLRYARGEGCDYNCPAGYKPIRSNASCLEAANTVTGSAGCSYGGGDLQPWSSILTTESSKDRPTGCYQYAACQGGCGLYLNEMETTSNATCGDCFGTNILCERDDDEPAELIAISQCEYNCPAGYEAIHDRDQCIQAAFMFQGNGCPYGGSWAEILTDEDDASKPEGCYFEAACQGGCGLRHNTQTSTSNSTCGDCYSTSLFCKKAAEALTV